jgi:hypothetical protein
VTGRHRLPDDWQPERVEVVDVPGGSYVAEWSAPTPAGLHRMRIVRSDDGVELFEAITDEEA